MNGYAKFTKGPRDIPSRTKENELAGLVAGKW